MNRISWDKYFLIIAKIVSSRSTCISKQFGAVITINNRIIATGYNGQIPGFPHCSDEGKCYKRELGDKGGNFHNCRAVHAEINALMQTCKLGISVDGGTIYCQASPCYDCYKALKSAGIKRFVFEKRYINICKEYEMQIRHNNEFEEIKIEPQDIFNIFKKNINLYHLYNLSKNEYEKNINNIYFE